jgi:hypothetical protein
MKCNKCEFNSVGYDGWICAWVANCAYLGTSKTVSEYTEDETDAPNWEEDLGQENTYCKYHVKEASK